MLLQRVEVILYQLLPRQNLIRHLKRLKCRVQILRLVALVREPSTRAWGMGRDVLGGAGVVVAVAVARGVVVVVVGGWRWWWRLEGITLVLI